MRALLTGAAPAGSDHPAPPHRGASHARRPVRAARVPTSEERLPSLPTTAHAKEPSMTTLELDRHVSPSIAVGAARAGLRGCPEPTGLATPSTAPPSAPAPASTKGPASTTGRAHATGPAPATAATLPAGTAATSEARATDPAVEPGTTRPQPMAPADPPFSSGTATRAATPAPAASPTRPAAAARTSGSPAGEAHLVPALPPAPRPAPGTGPGHTRPPTLEQRLLARRRATLAAERAARSAEVPREAAPMPDPTPVCCALALAATEALRGTRSVAQLARWVSPQVFEQLAGRAALTVRVLGRTTASRRPEVLRVRVCRLGEHIAEAAVVVDDGTRVRAVALRLEMWRGAWRAVAFEIG